MIKPDKMTRQEMLDLLGLGVNYTEEELKKAYRKMARDNHPDLNPGDKEKEAIFKAANNAFEELNKKFKKNTTHNSNYYEDTEQEELKAYRTSILKEIESLMNYAPTNSQEKFSDIIDEFVKLLENLKMNIVKFGFKISLSSMTKEGIKAEYDKFKEYYKNELTSFAKKFFKKYYVDENEIKETIDYNAKLSDYFDKLVELKNKYSKEAKYIKSIKDFANTYLNDPKYTNLHNLIRRILAKYLDIAKLRKYANIENIIVNLVTEIEGTIKKYEEYISKSNSIKEKLKELYGRDIIDTVLVHKDDESFIDNLMKVRNISESEIKIILELDRMDKDFNKLDENYMTLMTFEKTIENKRVTKERLEVVKAIHEKIDKKFKECLVNCTDISIQEKIIKVYNNYLEFYKLVRKGEISLEDYKKLECLTFADFENDNNILHNLCNDKEENSTNNILEGKNLIFVRKGKYKNLPYETFCYLIVKGEEMYMITPTKIGGIISSKITPEELKENYISFDEFMKNMKFDGRRSNYLNNWDDYCIVLYMDNDNYKYGIIYNDQTGEIGISRLDTYKHRYFDEDYVKTILPFEDKNKLAASILHMFEQRPTNFNKRNQFDFSNNVINKIEEIKILDDILPNLNNKNNISKILKY